MRLSDRLGGHIVQGHIDGTGSVLDRQRQGEWEMVWFRCPTELAGQMVPKGSVAVDGVSSDGSRESLMRGGEWAIAAAAGLPG